MAFAVVNVGYVASGWRRSYRDAKSHEWVPLLRTGLRLVHLVWGDFPESTRYGCNARGAFRPLEMIVLISPMLIAAVE